ncbi:TetR/AcrR family transcriptional regulator [Collimonas sp.]|jgi:TetR/AcrR family transcriptional repressor of lmrAB and yxaGH operons|uniref:TetR/AcrR family transcriptional regulator n=1 Tax=Collimonas sp. TaxID=1963772 RepID=UPI002CFBBD0C|nr:TetR/AcrR family transcriptional regulator [Collimonas sp.]HWW99539.1 TetR/AcrR family transcriptional regulator [Collimonas sp.]
MQDFRAKMIYKAIQLLPTHGYAGITLMHVARACKAPRGSLYHYFPGGKDDLMAAVLEAAKEYGLGTFIISSSRAPTLQGYFADIGKALAAALGASHYGLGCPVAAISMSTEKSNPLNQQCKVIYADWCLALQARLQAYGVPAAQAAALSANVLNTFQGALLHARLAGSAEPVVQAAMLLQRETRQFAQQN